jgi:tetratricopeptide (TPR) repeat protein
VAAVALYDSILTRDYTYREAALGAARALTWAGKFDSALARYDKWLIQNPRDIEAGLARARSLAWAGRLAQSERAYVALGAGGENLETQKGIAMVAAWRGDLSRSERHLARAFDQGAAGRRDLGRGWPRRCAGPVGAKRPGPHWSAPCRPTRPTPMPASRCAG